MDLFGGSGFDCLCGGGSFFFSLSQPFCSGCGYYCSSVSYVVWSSWYSQNEVLRTIPFFPLFSLFRTSLFLLEYVLKFIGLLPVIQIQFGRRRGQDSYRIPSLSIYDQNPENIHDAVNPREPTTRPASFLGRRRSRGPWYPGLQDTEYDHRLHCIFCGNEVRIVSASKESFQVEVEWKGPCHWCRCR